MEIKTFIKIFASECLILGALSLLFLMFLALAIMGPEHRQSLMLEVPFGLPWMLWMLLGAWVTWRFGRTVKVFSLVLISLFLQHREPLKKLPWHHVNSAELNSFLQQLGQKIQNQQIEAGEIRIIPRDKTFFISGTIKAPGTQSQVLPKAWIKNNDEVSGERSESA